MTDVKLHETHKGRIAVAESHALFRVTGKGVHNREFRHRVIKFADGLVLLSAQPIVIAANKVPTEDYDAGTVAIGDTLTVDGREFVVTARDLADPVLVEQKEATAPSVQALRCENGSHVYLREAARGRQPTSCVNHDGTGAVLKSFRPGSAAGEKAFAQYGGTVRSRRAAKGNK